MNEAKHFRFRADACDPIRQPFRFLFASDTVCPDHILQYFNGNFSRQPERAGKIEYNMSDFFPVLFRPFRNQRITGPARQSDEGSEFHDRIRRRLKPQSTTDQKRKIPVRAEHLYTKLPDFFPTVPPVISGKGEKHFCTGVGAACISGVVDQPFTPVGRKKVVMRPSIASGFVVTFATLEKSFVPLIVRFDGKNFENFIIQRGRSLGNHMILILPTDFPPVGVFSKQIDGRNAPQSEMLPVQSMDQCGFTPPQSEDQFERITFRLPEQFFQASNAKKLEGRWISQKALQHLKPGESTNTGKELRRVIPEHRQIDLQLRTHSINSAVSRADSDKLHGKLFLKQGCFTFRQVQVKRQFIRRAFRNRPPVVTLNTQ